MGIRGGKAALLCAALGLPALAMSAPASADTLKDALLKAYYDNPTLEAARAQQRGTDETVPLQRAAGQPTLNTTITHTEFLLQPAAVFIAPSRSLNGNLDLVVPLYQGGAVRHGVKAAEGRVRAGQSDLRGTESTIFNQVVAAYMDVIQQEAIVGLALNNLDVLQVTLDTTRDRFQIGDATLTDVAQAESRLALARGDLRTSQSNLINARERYVELVGEAPNDLETPPPLPGLPDDVRAAVEMALDSNPDLRAAHARAEASRHDIEVAGAARQPTVEAFSSGSYQNFLGTLDAFFGMPPIQVNIGVQSGVRMRVPILQGGRVSAQQRQAVANSQAALEQLVGTERAIIATVRAAYASWQAAEAVVESSQAAVDSAALSLEGVQAENTVGNRTILEILNAQQELLNARVQLVSARRNAYVAGFTLLAAMGRAEARDLGLDSQGVLYDPEANFRRVRGIIWDWQWDKDPVTRTTRTVDISPQDAEVPRRIGLEQD